MEPTGSPRAAAARSAAGVARVVTVLLLVAACRMPEHAPEDRREAPPPATTTATTPPPGTLASVTEGWEARVWLDQGAAGPAVGVWVVQCLDLVPDYAGPEIVALDDKGRLHVLFSYSGRMYAWQTLEDREWLGGLCLADVDPAVPGAELYTGGKRGNLYRVTWKPWAAFSVEALAHVSGELNNLVAADFEPGRPGLEFLAFLHPRGVVRLRPEAAFAEEMLLPDALRLRDAAVFRNGDRDAAMVASRDGTLGVLRCGAGGTYAIDVVARRSQGFGRVSKGPWTENGAPVFFAGCDDGAVLRVARDASGSWQAREVWIGTRGVRGVAADVFGADPRRETVAVFGYGREVVLLTRGDDGKFAGTTIFTDREKGHWLCAGELDDRNSTREIVACGFGGRVVVLSRTPGHGLDVPTAPASAGERDP